MKKKQSKTLPNTTHNMYEKKATVVIFFKKIVLQSKILRKFADYMYPFWEFNKSENRMKPKIIVTGGTGYIGSHTIIELIKSGQFEAVAVDSCVRSTPETIDRIEEITGVHVKHYNVDICDRNAFFLVIEQEAPVAGVIHFAPLCRVPAFLHQ